MMNLGEQKKLILPFVQRAQEVADSFPKIAYYCRLYGIQQALSLPPEELHPDIRELVDSLVASLEEARAGGLELTDDDAGEFERFGLALFGRADRADRELQQRDMRTALTFYAASIFLEATRQFGQPSDAVASKIKYAAWRAARIRKALRDGELPDPPPGTDEEGEEEDRRALEALVGGAGEGGGGEADEPAGAASGGHEIAFPDLPSAPTGIAAVADSAPEGPPPPLSHPSETAAFPPSPPRVASPFTPLSPTHFSRFSAGQRVVVRAAPVGRGEPAPVPAARRGVVVLSPDPAGHGELDVELDGEHRATEVPGQHVLEELREGDLVTAAPGHGGEPEGADGAAGPAAVPVAAVNLDVWPPAVIVRDTDGVFRAVPQDTLRIVARAEDHGPSADGLAELRPTLGHVEGGPGEGSPGPPSAEPSSGRSSPLRQGSPARSWRPASPPRHRADAPAAHPGPADARAGHHARDATQPPPPPQEGYYAPPGGSVGAAGPGWAAPAPPGPPPVRLAPQTALPHLAPTPGFEPDLSAITEAHKASRSASSALSFEDVPTAVAYLTEALRLLTQASR